MGIDNSNLTALTFSTLLTKIPSDVNEERTLYDGADDFEHFNGCMGNFKVKQVFSDIFRDRQNRTGSSNTYPSVRR